MARKPRPRTELTQIGDLLIDQATFDSKQRPLPTGCVEYTGPKHRQGYGFVGAWRVLTGEKIMATAHRIAARIKWGRAIEPDEMIVHTCSNPACVNPDHLVMGNRTTVHDIMRKNGRHAKTRNRQPK